MSKAVALQVCYEFWSISLPSSEKQQCEMTKSKEAHDGEFFISFLNLNTAPTNSVPR